MRRELSADTKVQDGSLHAGDFKAGELKAGSHGPIGPAGPKVGPQMDPAAELRKVAEICETAVLAAVS